MLGPFRASLPTLRRFQRAPRGLARKSPSLHPKFGNRLYYKGYGAPSMGRRTRGGGFVVDWDRKVPVYMVPDFEGCQLKPYVSVHTPKVEVPPPPI